MAAPMCLGRSQSPQGTFFFYSRSTKKLKSISRGLQLPGECLELDPQWPGWAGDWLLAVLPFPILSLARAHRVAKVSRIA